MSESQRILALSRRALDRGEKLCMATVVHVEGSAYRKPGARMLVTSGGERAGTISGGCLEAEVSRKAWWLSSGGARVERYSSFADEDGGMPYGLGCGGAVTLLLEQGEPVQAVLSALERVLSTREPAVIVTALGKAVGTLAILVLAMRGAAALPAVDHHQNEVPRQEEPEPLYLRSTSNGEGDNGSEHLNTRLMHAAARAFHQSRSVLLTSNFQPCDAAIDPPAYFVEYLGAPPAVTIFGAGDDAQPIAALAHVLGWRVTIADGRAQLARRDRFPQADEVRVLDYADPALRAACGMPRESSSTRLSPPPSWPPAHSGDFPGPRPAAVTTASPVRLSGALKSGIQRPLAGRRQPDPALVSDPIAIILTHSYEQDRALLTALLPRKLLYLGLLGPRHRTERLLLEVAPLLGVSLETCFARLHSPIGLDIGADDPSAVALSIIAEIQAVLHGRHVAVTRSPALASSSDDKQVDEVLSAPPIEKADPGESLANDNHHAAAVVDPLV